MAESKPYRVELRLNTKAVREQAEVLDRMMADLADAFVTVERRLETLGKALMEAAEQVSASLGQLRAMEAAQEGVDT